MLPCSVDGGDQLVRRELQLLRRALHDADVGLVRDQPVDVGVAAAGLLEHRAGDALEHADGELEHRRAVHLQQRIAEDLAARDVARHAEDVDVAAVGVQLGGEDAGRVARLEHDRAGAVAEQHAGGAVLEVEDAREHLGADDERLRGARRS